MAAEASGNSEGELGTEGRHIARFVTTDQVIGVSKPNIRPTMERNLKCFKKRNRHL